MADRAGRQTNQGVEPEAPQSELRVTRVTELPVHLLASRNSGREIEMTFMLDFRWEEAPGAKTLSNPGKAKARGRFCRSASSADAPPCRVLPQSRLIRLKEQVGSRSIPISFKNNAGPEKRIDYGCIKIASMQG